jgi:hypothetical protein
MIYVILVLRYPCNDIIIIVFESVGQKVWAEFSWVSIGSGDRVL